METEVICLLNETDAVFLNDEIKIEYNTSTEKKNLQLLSTSTNQKNLSFI